MLWMVYSLVWTELFAETLKPQNFSTSILSLVVSVMIPSGCLTGRSNSSSKRTGRAKRERNHSEVSASWLSVLWFLAEMHMFWSFGLDTGHVYEIYPQPEMPVAVDTDHHVHVWIEFLKSHMYGCNLEPDDWLFPSMSSNGIAQIGSHMSSNSIQGWIDKFTWGAGIDSTKIHLMTHCFRRGGAQYWFMFAPVGKRWTLATIC